MDILLLLYIKLHFDHYVNYTFEHLKRRPNPIKN